VTDDDELADRVRAALSGADERRMFGGLAFLLDGRLAVAVSGRGLMLRTDPAETGRLLTDPSAEQVVMRGRDMPGWLRVAPAGLTSDAALRAWVDTAVAYVRTLPTKGERR